MIRYNINNELNDKNNKIYEVKVSGKRAQERPQLIFEDTASMKVEKGHVNV